MQWVSQARRPSRCQRAPVGPVLAVERHRHSNVGKAGNGVRGARWPAIQARRKAARLDNSRFALAHVIVSAACFRSCAHGRPVFRRAVRPASRRRRQSVLEGQPRPASVRFAHHRGTRLTQWGLTPSLEDASTPLRDPLRRLRGRFIPFRHIPSRRQARHRSASTAPRRTRFAHKHSSRRVLPKHTPHSAAPAPLTRASADCEPNRSGYDARMGSTTRTCASVPSLIDSQTAAATKPDSGVSIRCNPLRFAATPDLETTNTLARASAVSLRSVPQLEAAGDRQADK